MANEKKMQLIRYPQGRVACVRGEIVKLFGLMVGFEWSDDIKGGPIKTFRIPLRDEALAPMKVLVDNTGFGFLFIGSKGDEITLDELMTLLQHKLYMDNRFDFDMVLRELDKLGVKIVNLNQYTHIPVVVEDDDRVFCKGCYFDKTHIICDLALLQYRLGIPVKFDVSCCTAEGVKFAERIEKFLERIRRSGLYYGDNGEKTVYYAGAYKFTGDGSDAVEMSFHDFNRTYKNIGLLIKSIESFY